MMGWIDPGTTSAAIAFALGMCGLAMLFWRRTWLNGTTLFAPWIWCVVSVASITCAEVFVGLTADGETSLWHDSLRFAAATTSFCPTMALLGAKRPQDKAWHLIVVSLWAVLILPAAEQFALQPDQPMEIQDARSWFLVALIAVCLLNAILTRYWPTALFCTMAQCTLFITYLPFSTISLGTDGTLMGLGFAVVGIVLVIANFPKQTESSRSPEDELWLDFRDHFGALWSVRVAERINAAAKMYEWDIALAWDGFHRTDDSTEAEIPPEIVETLHQTMKNLMRRFVSNDWIEERLNR